MRLWNTKTVPASSDAAAYVARWATALGMKRDDYMVLEGNAAILAETLMRRAGDHIAMTTKDLLNKMLPNLVVRAQPNMSQLHLRRCTASTAAVIRGEACPYCRRPYDGITKRCGGCAGSPDPLHSRRSASHTYPIAIF